MPGARNFFLPDPIIFWPRRCFLPFFGCFQILLSLLSNSVNRVAHCWSQIVQNLLSLLNNSVNLEGPLLEPICSQQIESTNKGGFQKLLSYSVDCENAEGQLSRLVLGGKTPTNLTKQIYSFFVTNRRFSSLTGASN